MEKENNITTILDNTAPMLSDTERSASWSVIEQKTMVQPASQPIAVSIISPYQFIFNTSKKVMITAAFALFITTTGGVAFASNAARPGDVLFPLDRALEDVQLRLIRTEEAKTHFKNSLSRERVAELQTIVDEQVKTGFVQSDLLSEQRVGNAMGEIVRFIDKSSLSEESKKNLVSDLSKTLRISGELERHEDTFRVRTKNSDEHTKMRIDEDGESRVEFYSDGERVRIENKDGEIRIKTKSDYANVSERDSETNEDTLDNEDDGDDDSGSLRDETGVDEDDSKDESTDSHSGEDDEDERRDDDDDFDDLDRNEDDDNDGSGGDRDNSGSGGGDDE